MRGKIEGSRNPAQGTRAQVRQAQDLFADFSGHNPEKLRKVKVPTTRVGFVVGPLDGVLYTAKRDGKTERYIHKFRKGSRPLLVSSSDGKTLHIVGGRYAFTNAGIEDE